MPRKPWTTSTPLSTGKSFKNVFIALDRILKRIEPLIPVSGGTKPNRLAVSWTKERMVGEGGIGAIFPAMANAVMALKTMGFPDNTRTWSAASRPSTTCLWNASDYAYCQPCLSPIWDTCLSLSALSRSRSSHETTKR